jgi:hypothetical protein
MGDVTLKELLEEFDAGELDEELEEFASIERQVEKALVEGIDGAADVRMVQSILLSKIISVAITLGVSEKRFEEIVSDTWRLVEWSNEKHGSEVH